MFSGSKVSDLVFEEFNGFPGKNGFNASPKLTQRIAAQLVKPFMFDYTSGHVGDIHASAEISDTVVNIVRGILGFFQVTVKTTQRIYELEEVRVKSPLTNELLYSAPSASILYSITKHIINVTFYFVCRLASMASVRVTMLQKKTWKQRT